MKKLKLYALIAMLPGVFAGNLTYAQDSLAYTAAEKLMIVGKAKVTSPIFERIDAAETAPMPAAVQRLARNSAGVAFIFETNSPTIAAKWTLAEERYHANMTPIAHSGLDLYCFIQGKWQYVAAAGPAKGAVNQSQVIIRRMDTTRKQFMLYLPLYNTVTDLQIGIQRNSAIGLPKQAKLNTAKRVVVYGSSIVQGASASRPGLAYPAILQRQLGIDVVNLGFSGSAKMEMELAKYLATVPADCYVLDCIPNQTPAQVKERAVPFIKYLRAKRPNTPIILVETVVRENGYFDQQIGENVRMQNLNTRQAYEQLLKEGHRNIQYIPAQTFMGTDHDGTIDGVHLTDVGFSRIAEAVMKALKKVI